MMRLGILAILFACNDKIEVETTTELIIIDYDKDGFSADVDCDDEDVSVHPDAIEICDGRDNNCSGEVDEDVTAIFYPDGDGDGFGSERNPLAACAPPAGYIVVGNDCDDEDSDIYPGAIEICDEKDNDCDDEIDENLLQGLFLDADGDGHGDPRTPAVDCSDNLSLYVRDQLDCDDSNIDVYPGAIEICDEIDNDCDGAIDEAGSGNQVWYRDSDLDGFGDILNAMNSCMQPAGWVSDSTDCDDDDATQYPGADEWCNNEDDDCDGNIDENPQDPIVFYQDADNDGFGSMVSTLPSCLQPAGYVSNNTDCDDTNPSVSPTAPEICNLSDDDCDGNIDENAIGIITLYEDVDGDGYGDVNSPIESCDPVLSGYVLNALDCNDGASSQNPLGIETCNGFDDNCNGLIDEGAIDATIWFYDNDGDGYGDISIWELGCTGPADYVSVSGDCDDNDPNYSPATPEICDGVDQNCNGQTDEGLPIYEWYYDDDGDGYGDPWTVIQSCEIIPGMIQDNTDCDDDDAYYNPDTPELCNGVDDNCNGQIDEGFTIHQWYYDNDGDGFGSPWSYIASCAIIAGMVEDANDCDDFDPNHNPDTLELCNGVDDNCNGQIDEGFPIISWYLDADGDGFGNPFIVEQSCAVVSGRVQDNTDCDDDDAYYNPDTPELCNGVDDNCDGQVDEGFTIYQWYYDNDGDGFGSPSTVIESCAIIAGMVQNNTDCDDSNPSYNPNTPEICDGLDQNCDGQIDEGFTIYQWYYDNDGDGFGSPSTVIQSCSVISGMVEDNTDCDDSDANHNPGSLELCNGLDDDCDGQIDEGFTIYQWYYDNDGDGFGSPSAVIQSCSVISGMVEDNTDCDDSDANHNPDTPESCNGLDDDCDGQIDEGFTVYQWYYDDDEDGFGDPSTVIESCEVISGMIADNTDCDDNDAGYNPDTPELCNGLDDNCDGQIDEGFPVYQWYYDSDGDGFGDPSTVIESCEVISGMIADNTDCDDNDAGYNPNTPELCDGIDQNCNGQIDEGFPVYQWYYDDDGDGYGDPWVEIESCAQIAGMVGDNTDCDDGDSNVNPGEEEWCSDGIDNNCDGYFDDETSVDAFSGYLDLDGDGYAGGDLEYSCDDIYYATADDCDDDDPFVNPAASEVCDGIDNDCDANIDTNQLCRGVYNNCRLRRYDGSAYLFCRYERIWSVAKGDCSSVGYHLVTINDAAEDAWIDGQVDTFASNFEWWIGYNDLTLEGYWGWDGPYSTYTNWASSEPNDWQGGEDCTLLNSWAGGQWNDASCMTATYYVCEANP